MTAPRPPAQLLLAKATDRSVDDNARWDAISDLHHIGDEDILSACQIMAVSTDPWLRSCAANIVAQLGVPNRSFPEASRALIAPLLSWQEEDDVLHDAIVGCGHLYSSDEPSPAVPFHTHPNESVRHGVAFALHGHDQDDALDALIALSKDSDADVRDWAACGLRCGNSNATKVADALAARLDDAFDIRHEAFAGLARRGDMRVLEPLYRQLSAEHVSELALEAAGYLAHRDLLPLLENLRDTDGDDHWNDLLRAAILECSQTPDPDDHSFRDRLPPPELRQTS